MKEDLQILVDCSRAFRRFGRIALGIGFALCAIIFLTYYRDLGARPRRSEARVVVMSGGAALLLLMAMLNTLRAPGIVALLEHPERMKSYRVISQDGKTIHAIWIFVEGGRHYEVPIMSKLDNAGERALAALLEHAPHLTQHTG